MRYLLIALLVIGCNGALKHPAPKVRAYTPRGPIEDPVGAKIAPGAVSIELVTEDGVIIEGTFWDSDAPDPVTAIFVHQLSSDRYEWAPLIRSLREMESSRARIIAIDMRGHGKSTRTTDGRALSWRKFSDSDWKQTPLDVKAAVTYARGLTPENQWIALTGSSIGSSAVILYAAQDPQIWRVAMFSPGLSYHGLDIRDAYAKVLKRTEEEAPFPPSIYAASGDADSVKAAEALGGDVVIVEGNAHGIKLISEDDPENIISDMNDFVLAAD
jgi:pimeloyl-ACP methyl ester carboxylesterase